MRSFAWKPWEGEGAEYLTLTIEETIRARGTAIRPPSCVDYVVECDAGWRTRCVVVELRDHGRIELSADGNGTWSDSTLHGCIDVDIAVTPFTNTLPIRRLGLEIGRSEEIQVAYVRLPELRVERVLQQYTRIAPQRYRYEGLTTGFVAEIDVDGEGVVIDYPKLCRRLWPRT